MFKNISIIDGGLSSALQDKGYKIDGDPLWSARLLHTDPDAISQVHKDFLQNGAQLLITSSYQASIDGFKKYLDISREESLKLIEKSVDLAKHARESHSKEVGDENTILVGGSVGPYGACQSDGSEYHGDYMKKITEEVIINWHRPRIEVLIESNVDFLAIETFPALTEAVAVIKLLKEYPTTKYWICFSCRDGNSTNAGDPIGKSAEICYELGKGQIEAIGINCTHPKYVTELLNQLNLSNIPSSEDFPRVIYPNSGEDWDSVKGWINTYNKEEFLTKLPEWKDKGAKMIGGCCRVNSSTIKEIYKSFN